jgi:hypothetical protein
MKTYLLCCCILLAATPALADSITVYEGTVGRDMQVVLELSHNSKSGAHNGRYFYRKSGVDIPLSGTYEHLAEPGVTIAGGGSEPGAVWSGKEKDGIYSGIWVGGKNNRSYRFKLKRIAVYNPDGTKPGTVEAVTAAITPGVGSNLAYDAMISNESTPYEYRKVNVAMQQGTEVIKGGVGYRLVSDPRTVFAYPRLSRHPDQAVLQSVNRILEQRHWHMMLNALSCASTAYDEVIGPSSGSLGSYDQERIEVAYLSPTLMTVIEAGSTYCGGAHPNNHFEPFTLDLIRGEYLDFNRLFRITSTVAADQSDNQVDRGYSAELMELIREAQKKGACRDSQCSDSKDEADSCLEQLPSYLSLYFREQDRLVFGISGIGHALGCCLGDQLELPFNALSTILRPEAGTYINVKQTAIKGSELTP